MVKVSKHLLIVAIAVVVIAVGLAAAFVFVKPDPQKITLDAIEKQLELNEYVTVYNLTYNTKASGLSLDANGLITVTKKDDITKVSLAIDTFGERIRVDQYQTGDGEIIQCVKSFLNLTCQRVSQSSIPLRTPQEQSAALKDLIDTNSLELSYVSSKSIAGRNCDQVHSIYDPKKEDPLAQVEGNLIMDVCLDKENGLPLQMKMTIDLSTSAEQGTIAIDMTMTDVSFKAASIVLPEESSFATPDQTYFDSADYSQDQDYLEYEPTVA